MDIVDIYILQKLGLDIWTSFSLHVEISEKKQVLIWFQIMLRDQAGPSKKQMNY